MHHVNRIEFAYDGFGRVTGRTYSNTSGANRRVTTYTYQDVGTDKTTTLLKSVNNSGFGELGYEYDAVGNITQITKDRRRFYVFASDISKNEDREPSPVFPRFSTSI